eukprot:gene22060-28155_t
MAEYLEVVSLSDNQLGSKGVVILCEALGRCQHLTDLDLSRNRLTDSCADMLTKTLSTNKIEIKHLNLSHNALSGKCVHFFIQRIATHKSELLRVDLGHNPDLGDGVTAFLSLLLFNKPSHLQSFDVSYCGITDSGVKELSLALPYCTSLQSAGLLGTFNEPLTLQALMESVGKHHRNRSLSATTSGVVVAIGGVHQECSESALTVPFKSLKVALPYLSEVTGLHTAVLRRRLLLHSDSLSSTGGLSGGAHPFTKFSCGLDRFSHQYSRGDESRLPSAYPLLLFTVQMPAYMASVEEFVEALASGLKADASQFRVVSATTPAPRTGVFCVTLTVSELSDTRARILRERNMQAYQQLKLPSLLHGERVLTVDDIFISLESLASRSHPLLKRLGVRAVDVQFPAEDGEIIRTQVTLSGATEGGRGLEDHYIPPLSPQDVSQYEGYAAASDTEDDDTFDRELRGADSALDGIKVAKGEDEDEEPLEVGVSVRRQSLRRRSLTQSHKAQVEEPVMNGMTREAYINKLAEKRQMRANNERLVLAVRQLYADGEVSSGVAKFWEGAFGHLKHKEVTRQGMLTAIEPVSNVFHAVRKRLLLCNAMFQRDLGTMKVLLDEFKSHVIEGGATYVYAQRLYSELIGLQRRFPDVQHMATDYENLHIVEEYLLACGTLGYSGPEMFQAVELRQALVALGVSSGNRNVMTDLGHIKYKALLSNLLISREMFALESKMEEGRRGGEDALQFLAETIATQTLLAEYTNCMNQLDLAIVSQEIETIDSAIAIAAYHYFFSPAIDTAIVEMNNLSRNPARLLSPIVNGLRDSDLLAVERAFLAVNSMGWRHPALDAVLCSKIHAKKSKIVQDDSIKNKLISLCLAVKNGLTVRAGEMMQLLRRANAIGLEEDADMKPYLMILNKHMKRFSGLVKQERIIQTLIDDNDVAALSQLLAGRGTGKLVMRAPSAYAQEEWIAHLEECCSGNFMARLTEEAGGDSELIDDHEVFFTGSLEKAARNEQGKVSGWRRRFFVLEAVMLAYWTKAHGGEKKGTIRVLGGGVRKMDPSETGGRPFCIELQEGRDISLINPDLLDEAKKQVRLSKIHEIEATLRKGVKLCQLDVLVRTVQFASDFGIILDFELMNSARDCIAVLREKNLKRDLHSAARLVPESTRLFELINLAESLKADPNIPSYRRVVQLAGKTEVEQCLLRALGALETKNHDLFRKTFKTIAKFDVSTALNTRQRYMLAAIILQHCGYLVLTMVTDGAPVALVYKTLRHALSCCRELMVETECMDAARLLIALTVSLTGGGAQIPTSPKDAVTSGERVSSIAMYLEDMRLFNRSKQSVGLGLSAVFASRSHKASMVDLMSHNSTALAKSLLKYEQGVLDQPLCVEAFTLLFAIMGDKSLSSLARPRKGGILRSKPRDVDGVVLDLLDAASVRHPVIRDELYFQLAKQLTNNPNRQSRSRGWLLMSLYLHAFHPSLEALPYIKNFVADNLERMIVARHLLLHGDGDAHEYVEEDQSTCELDYFVHLASYCSKLVCALEVTMDRSVDIRTASAAASSSSAVSHVSAEVVSQVFDQSPLNIELVLMTGSVYQFAVPYGQFNTPFSLLGFLYDRLVPSDEQNMHRLDGNADGDEEALEAVSNDQYHSSHVRAHQVLSLFRGFGLFSVEPSNLNEEASDVDLCQVPVQPEVHNVVPWSDDLQWDLLLSTCNPEGEENQVQHSRFLHGKTLILRRQTALASERFSDEYGLFKDTVSARDVTALQGLWTAWLQSSGVHTHLPVDHVRLDLVFAEDSRYVNSRLYPLSDDSFHYLLAIQLALCWIDDASAEWGEGDDGVIDKVTISVRPCYKFFPRHRHTLDDGGLEEDVVDTAGRRKSGWHVKVAPAVSAAREEDDSDEETERLRAKMVRRMRHEEGGGGDETSEEEDEDENDDAESSEYVSSADENEAEQDAEGRPVEKRKVLLPPIVGNYEDLSEEQREMLAALIDRLGVSLEAVDVERLVQNVRLFHSVAADAEVALTSNKYRYLLKRAYVQYLTSACPLYGSHLSEVTLVGMAQEQEKGSRLQPSDDQVLSALEEHRVLVGVSASGLIVMDAESWAVLFSAACWDIQECSVSEVSVAVAANKKAKPKGKRGSNLVDAPSSEEIRKVDMLRVSVNSLALTFKGDKLREIAAMLETYTREVLGRGCFPLGTESTASAEMTDGQGGAQGSVMTFTSGKQSSVAMQSIEAKNVLQQFLQFYPMLPRPPLPEMITYSERFLEAPKSRRELLARERAEEERVENEMVRLAAESQMERNQRQIKQGREEMKRYQSENEASDNGGEDNENDSEGDEEGGRPKSVRSSTNRKSKRQNRSVFTKSIGTVELREQINHQRLTAAVCGVSERTISQLKNVVIPAVPTRIGGVVKTEVVPAGVSHADQRKRMLYKPVMEESTGWAQLAEGKPVGLSWTVSASHGQVAAAVAATPTGKTKKCALSTSAAEAADRMRQAILQQHENRISRCMRRIEGAEAVREAQFALVSEHTLHSHSLLLNAVAALSLDSEDDGDRRAPVNKMNEKDAYLYGVSHFGKMKKVAGKRGVSHNHKAVEDFTQRESMGGAQSVSVIQSIVNDDEDEEDYV